MSIKQKLQNPFALVAQGFIAGAILFWATAPGDVDPSPRSAPIESAATATDLTA